MATHGPATRSSVDRATNGTTNAMHVLSRLRLRTKLALLMALSAVAVTVAVIVGASAMHQRMYDDRVDKLRAVVQGVRSFATALETQVAAGKLTQDQAL